MNQPYKPPQTLNEAAALLRALEFPVYPQNVLLEIGKGEGANFKNALATVANKGPNHERARDYLCNVLMAYSPGVANVIRAIGYRPAEPTQLLGVLRQEGRAARMAFRTLMTNPKDADTGKYIRSLLDPLGLPPEDQNPTANIPSANDANTPPSTQGRVRQQHASENPSYDEMEAARQPPPAETTDKPEIQSAHIYGGKASFCFTKDKTQTGGYPTVTIDAAPVKPNAEKSYDWKKKVIFQLTVGELALVYGVLTGRLESIKLMGHGKTNNKSLTMEDQGGNYFFSMQVRNEASIAIPALAKDTFRPMMMLWEQIQLNAPGVHPYALEKMIARVCDKYIAETKRKAA